MLSTTWRQEPADRRAVLRELSKYGLGHRVIGDTPAVGTRGNDCRAWLKDNLGGAGPHVAFAVLDDDKDSVLSGTFIPASRFVCTTRATGLTEADADKTIELLSTAFGGLAGDK